jgi:hypothetical protein
MKTSNLETRIASALTNDGVASRELAALLTELNAAISVADETAEAAREKALDPISLPDVGKAEQLAWAAKLNRDRLRSLLSRVRQRLDELEEAEYAAQWQADYEAAEAKRNAIAKEMAELYPNVAKKLCDLFQRAEAVDKECLRVNGEAPTGEQRRLRGVELTARNLGSFSRYEPSILEAVKLPEWKHSGRMAWPPPKAPLAVVLAASMTPPPDPRFSADWAAARERDNARRKQEEERRAKEEEARQVESKRAYEGSLRR